MPCLYDPSSWCIVLLGAQIEVDANRFSCAGGSLRGRGWKYGSGFVDGVFPVLSPMAEQILKFLLKEVDTERIWTSLDTLPPTHNLWDDLINVAVELRINKQWNPIVSVRCILKLKAEHRGTFYFSLIRKVFSRCASGFCSRAPFGLM